MSNDNEVRRLASDTEHWRELRATGKARKELRRAISMYPPFRSRHEGYAIIREELDELWMEIKRKPQNEDAIEKEAVQLSAMALRFIMDCCKSDVENEQR